MPLLVQLSSEASSECGLGGHLAQILLWGARCQAPAWAGAAAPNWAGIYPRLARGFQIPKALLTVILLTANWPGLFAWGNRAHA